MESQKHHTLVVNKKTRVLYKYLGDDTYENIQTKLVGKLKPDDATAYYIRGSAKYILEDMIGACLDWSKAGELGYSDAYTSIKDYCQ